MQSLVTSIVIPTHNRAEMVRDAIGSALSLPGSEFREIIVVNDGSTDNTAEVLREFGDRIRVIHAQHGERSRARNAGLQAARAEFVAFLDDDDLLLPEGLPTLEQLLESASPDVGLVYGSFRPVSISAEVGAPPELPRNLGASGWMLGILLRNNFIQPGALLARTQVLQQLGGFDAAFPPVEDYHLWLRVAARWQILHAPVEVAAIRHHGGNSSLDKARMVRFTEASKEACLTSGACISYLRRLPAELREVERASLCELCLDLARRHWWEGKMLSCRKAFLQGLHLDSRRALGTLGVVWKAWLPRRGVRHFGGN